MKSARFIIAIFVLSSGLMGCANPAIKKMEDNSNRIGSMAQTAKNNFEECLMKKDKKEADLSACEEVEANLRDIVNAVNELPDIVKRYCP